MSTIQQIHYDLVDAFMNRVDPTLGWEYTIVADNGHQTIADVVNAHMLAQGTFTDYSAAQIGWAITWMHKHGKAEFGATITKVGPWLDQRVFHNSATGQDFTVTGNIYVMVGTHQRIDAEIWALICSGLKQWGQHELSCNENDVIMLSLYGTIIPNPNSAQTHHQQAVLAAITTYKQVVMQAVRDMIAALP